ncbi:MAG TPA: alpha-hydroxy acid oxidase [Kofleriaceae bacterium]|nr:alpha-hydroxy acid oxidase [Kofleriaceae bacterium]
MELDPVDLSELEELARAALSPMAWDYYASGADDELTLRKNRDAFDRYELHYRVLAGTARRDIATSVLGAPVSLPVLVAPTAFHRLAHPDGELATARAAGEAGTVLVLSTLSNTRVEDVVAAARGPVWFQLYVYRDRAATEALVRRVEAAGCSALVLTVDTPLLGRRRRDVRNRFNLPAELRIENQYGTGTGLDRLPAGVSDSGLAAYFAQVIDPGLTWRDIEWLRGVTRLPLVLKGVVRPDDAVRAARAGVAGLMVSNHGGRQLDGAPATIDVLAPICDAVGGALEVLVDGGIRRGTDIIKAIALGARAVLIGRPVLWGLAVGGQAGVAAVIAVLRRELDLAMALCGCPSIAAVGRDLIRPAP